MTDHQFTSGEQNRYRVISALIEGKLTNDHAATMLGMTVRQIQRLKGAVLLRGKEAVVHRLKGRPSNHRIAPAKKDEALNLLKQQYRDFKPGFASEKLQELHDIPITSQTIRMWMSEAGLWKPRAHKKRGAYRSWRQRKEYFGELEQFDGSYHYWFENRYRDGSGNPIEVCLLASIDDATGRITHAVFAPHEGVVPVFEFWKSYLLTHGKPLAIYLDKFSTYKINHKNAVDNSQLMTQFQRATRDLNIALITANSPQAKGRVERLFGTLQDRLVKELRLANVSAPEEGNSFLKDVFIPTFNGRFAVVPEKLGDVHRPLTTLDQKELNRIFSVQSTRTINNDFTIQFKVYWFQLEEIQPTTVRPKEKVLVEEWLNGRIYVSIRGHYLKYFTLPERPKKVANQPLVLTTHQLNWTAPKDHPWRRSRP